VFRIVLLLVALGLLLPGCALTKARRSTGKREVAAPVVPQGPIGRVTAVNRALGFVLIDAPNALRLPVGTELLAGETGPDAGRLRLSAERRRPFVTADIVDGAVAEGDLVFRVPPPSVTP